MMNEIFSGVEGVPDSYFSLWMTVGRIYPSARLEFLAGAGYGFYGGNTQQVIGWT